MRELLRRIAWRLKWGAPLSRRRMRRIESGVFDAHLKTAATEAMVAAFASLVDRESAGDRPGDDE